MSKFCFCVSVFLCFCVSVCVCVCVLAYMLACLPVCDQALTNAIKAFVWIRLNRSVCNSKRIVGFGGFDRRVGDDDLERLVGRNVNGHRGPFAAIAKEDGDALVVSGDKLTNLRPDKLNDFG